jgi:hypothetical protein
MFKLPIHRCTSQLLNLLVPLIRAVCLKGDSNPACGLTCSSLTMFPNMWLLMWLQEQEGKGQTSRSQ